MQHTIICVNIHPLKTGMVKIFPTANSGSIVIDGTAIARQQVNALTIAAIIFSRQQFYHVQMSAASPALRTGKYPAAKNRHLIHIK